MQTRVYVDGFNLYYRLKEIQRSKGIQTKWLNLVELATIVLPNHCNIEKLRYFTARVSGIPDSGAPARQQVYIKALQSLPEVEVHFGRFLTKTIWRPVINLPLANMPIQVKQSATVVLPKGNHSVTELDQILSVDSYPADVIEKYKKRRKSNKPLPNSVKAEVYALEEKGSDVSLACHLLNDAWKGLFDMAAVISNDTDLVPSVEIVMNEIKKPVVVVCPKENRVAKNLQDVAHSVRYIHQSMIKKSQFPDVIPGTSIIKPAEW